MSSSRSISHRVSFEQVGHAKMKAKRSRHELKKKIRLRSKPGTCAACGKPADPATDFNLMQCFGCQAYFHVGCHPPISSEQGECARCQRAAELIQAAIRGRIARKEVSIFRRMRRYHKQKELGLYDVPPKVLLDKIADISNVAEFLRIEQDFSALTKEELVAEHGKDGRPNKNGQTTLQVAAQHGHVYLCRFLVEERHAEVDRQDGGGWTPLMQAAYGGHILTVKYLVEEAHANLEMRNHGPKYDGTTDNMGECALDTAVAKAHRGVIAYLIGTGRRPDLSWDGHRICRNQLFRNGCETLKAMLRAPTLQGFIIPILDSFAECGEHSQTQFGEVGGFLSVGDLWGTETHRSLANSPLGVLLDFQVKSKTAEAAGGNSGASSDAKTLELRHKIFQHPVVTNLLNEKWKRFGFHNYIVEFARHIVLTLTFFFGFIVYPPYSSGVTNAWARYPWAGGGGVDGFGHRLGTEFAHSYTVPYICIMTVRVIALLCCLWEIVMVEVPEMFNLGSEPVEAVIGDIFKPFRTVIPF